MEKIMTSIRRVAGLCFLLPGLVWAELTPEQEAARTEGIKQYNMMRGFIAKPYLEIAAQAGDGESQYYLAEYIRLRKKHITPEAQALYEAAAAKGDVYAMMRLSDKREDLCHIMENCPPDLKTPEQWLAMARSLAKERASQGNAEAIHQLFLLGDGFDLLIQSAQAGFPPAQYRLAGVYREGFGTFWIPGNREKEVEKWYRAAAENGHPPGMIRYGELLKSRSDRKGYGDWFEKAAQAGHFGATMTYAAWTAHMPDQVGYPLDLVKAYGLKLLVAEAAPGRGPIGLGYGEEALLEVAAKMTPEQIEAGKAYAREWAKTHPPLSRFPLRYGY